MPDTPLLAHLIAAAIEAGRAAHAVYRGEFTVDTKADESPVTAADHAAERIILAHLSRVAPGVAVVAEEQVAAGNVPETSREFFLVDPVDGTKEFIEKRGDFTVNIALVRDGVPQLGVVYAPARSRLFCGDVGAGKALRSAQSPDDTGQAPLEPIRTRAPRSQGLTVVASRSHRSPETDAWLARVRVAEMVSVGSSLKFCLVASGEADLYPRLGPTMEWDTAAGHAVLVAAGGAVVHLDGAPFLYGKPEFRNPPFVAAGRREALPPTS